MKLPKDHVWVVSAISKLTGEREAFSSPKPKAVAIELVKKALKTKSSKRAFLYPRVDRCENYPPYYNRLL